MSNRDHDTAPTKVIVFRFHGGRHDGSVLRSDSSMTEGFVRYFWTLTWEGTVGRRFEIRHPEHAAFDRYQVRAKEESELEIAVICEVIE